MGLISILPKARKKFTTNFTPLAEYSLLSHYDITFLLMEYIRPVCISSYQREDKCGKSVLNVVRMVLMNGDSVLAK
jgi:hypothetical protein